uniref:hypothetical protein n=1 Tax=Mycobacterium tuberculosis TaxID=1773 RepID=UPI00214DDEBD
DWDKYRQRNGKMQRLERSLEEEGKSVKNYQEYKLVVFKLRTAYEWLKGLVGSEMCIGYRPPLPPLPVPGRAAATAATAAAAAPAVSYTHPTLPTISRVSFSPFAASLSDNTISFLNSPHYSAITTPTDPHTSHDLLDFV